MDITDWQPKRRLRHLKKVTLKRLNVPWKKKGCKARYFFHLSWSACQQNTWHLCYVSEQIQEDFKLDWDELPADCFSNNNIPWHDPSIDKLRLQVYVCQEDKNKDLQNVLFPNSVSPATNIQSLQKTNAERDKKEQLAPSSYQGMLEDATCGTELSSSPLGGFINEAIRTEKCRGEDLKNQSHSYHGGKYVSSSPSRSKLHSLSGDVYGTSPSVTASMAPGTPSSSPPGVVHHISHNQRSMSSGKTSELNGWPHLDNKDNQPQLLDSSASCKISVTGKANFVDSASCDFEAQSCPGSSLIEVERGERLSLMDASSSVPLIESLEGDTPWVYSSNRANTGCSTSEQSNSLHRHKADFQDGSGPQREPGSQGGAMPTWRADPHEGVERTGGTDPPGMAGSRGGPGLWRGSDSQAEVDSIKAGVLRREADPRARTDSGGGDDLIGGSDPQRRVNPQGRSDPQGSGMAKEEADNIGEHSSGPEMSMATCCHHPSASQSFPPQSQLMLDVVVDLHELIPAGALPALPANALLLHLKDGSVMIGGVQGTDQLPLSKLLTGKQVTGQGVNSFGLFLKGHQLQQKYLMRWITSSDSIVDPVTFADELGEGLTSPLSSAMLRASDVLSRAPEAGILDSMKALFFGQDGRHESEATTSAAAAAAVAASSTHFRPTSRQHVSAQSSSSAATSAAGPSFRAGSKTHHGSAPSLNTLVGDAPSSEIRSYYIAEARANIRRLENLQVSLDHTRHQKQELEKRLNTALESHTHRKSAEFAAEQALAKIHHTAKRNEIADLKLRRCRDRSAVLRTTLRSRVTSLTASLRSLEAAELRRQEADGKVHGPELQGALTNLRARVTGRCNRMVCDLGNAYQLGVSTTDVIDLAPLEDRLDDSWWAPWEAEEPISISGHSHSTESASIDGGSHGNASLPDSSARIIQSGARLAIGGLELRPQLLLSCLGFTGRGGPFEDDKSISAALGYVAHVVDRLAVYFHISLRHPIIPAMSRSRIFSEPEPLVQDNTSQHSVRTPSLYLHYRAKTPHPQPPKPSRDQLPPFRRILDTPATDCYPLYYDSRDRSRLAKGVFFLHKDIEQLMEAHGLTASGPADMLQNLYTLVATAAPAVPSRPRGIVRSTV